MPPWHARPSRRPATVAAAAMVALACTPLAALRAHASTVPWGTVLVSGQTWAGPQIAALGDVNVYSNGDGSQDQTSTYGLSYECVELAQRFAAVRYNEQRIWPVSYAYQMWAAGPQLRVPLIQEPNGGASPPQAGDIMVFDRSSTSSTGHVAVVADTGPGYVDIVEQNWNNTNPTGTARLTITGTTIGPRSGLPVLGWLRSPTAAIPRLPVLVTSGGGSWPYNNARTYGSLASSPPVFPVVGGASTQSGHGYWMDASDGGVFSFGDATFLGSMGGHPLNKPIVGMAPTPTGKGYWLVASDGGIFSFGDAQFYGSMGGKHLNLPVVGMTPTPTGKGYWMVASDGGIFSFGDAQFFGSMGGHPLNKPVDAIAATATGNGYWMVASDGGIFAFGDAQFFGSAGSNPPKTPVAAMTATSDGLGYWLTAADGTVLAYGDATYIAGSGKGSIGPTPVVGVVTTL